jgi:hypothetical protein
VEKSFSEIFEIELKCWFFGVSHTSEKVNQKVLHQVIKEMAPLFREAIEHNYVFSISEVSKRLIEAGKCKASEKEIAFSILSELPTPSELLKDQYETLKKIVQKAENVYGGAFDRLSKKWTTATKNDFSNISLGTCSRTLDFLTMPGKPSAR